MSSYISHILSKCYEAQNPKADPDSLARFAHDPEFLVRYWALRNPNIPYSVWAFEGVLRVRVLP